jgi:hypothetical protein
MMALKEPEEISIITARQTRAIVMSFVIRACLVLLVTPTVVALNAATA